MTTTARSLLLIGAVGVGKTTVTGAVEDLLAERGTAGAAIDLDQIRRAWPAPSQDRFQQGLELENLAAMSRIYRARGALVLVAAGVIEEREHRAAYEEAFGCALTVVRLTGPRDVVRERLHRRHADDEERLAWHLERFDELTAILNAAQIQDVTLEIDATPRGTAERLLDLCGL